MTGVRYRGRSERRSDAIMLIYYRGMHFWLINVRTFVLRSNLSAEFFAIFPSNFYQANLLGRLFTCQSELMMSVG